MQRRVGVVWSAILILALGAAGGPVMAVEEPPYRVGLHEGDVEVREYPALIAAEVEVGGDRDQAANAGFRLLAAYIFGGNTRRQHIDMTAPVVQERKTGESIAMTATVVQSGGDGSWSVRFIMPQGYTLATLPVPDDARVKLVPLAPQCIAVIRFSGLARPDEVAARTQSLQAFIDGRHWSAAGAPLLARYNPPWTLWFMRRNEVWIPLVPERPH